VILLLAALSAFLVGSLSAAASGRNARSASISGTTCATVGCGLGASGALDALASGKSATLALRWPIPEGALSLGIDALSAFFLIPLFVLGAVAAVYGFSYLLAGDATRSLALPWTAFNALLASMALVVLARHALLFLVAWEIMSLSAYLLVTFEHELLPVRRAGWVYLIATHIGVAFLIGMFLLLGTRAGSFEFAAMQTAGAPRAGFSALLFGLALIGFGAKAGLVPLHVWLPEAHAAAPSHVSALMSGVLIKLGIYGLLRMVVLLGGPRAWWGPLLIGLGVAGAALGIALAVYQRDLKRALAYSSVENVGLIVLGIGVGFWGASIHNASIATLGLAGALLHVYNHAAIKGLLFLGSGNVLHGCHTRDLERMGGLGRRMPRTMSVFLLGAAAIAGLPPLNGFVSEWLLYSGLMHGALEVSGAGGVAAAGALAGLSLVGALTALCFVRLVGVAFLGEPRSPEAASAHEAPRGMTASIGALGFLALLLALAPQVIAVPIERVVRQVLDTSLVPSASDIGLTRLGAINVVIALVLATAVALVFAVQRARRPVSDRTWSCGYAASSPRMQYGARATSELFTALILPASLSPRVSARVPEGVFPAPARLESDTADPLTRGAYEPFFARWAGRFARLRWMQQGFLHLYLVYILFALLLALGWSSAQRAWIAP
jgi:hydrogenase-4 component B